MRCQRLPPEQFYLLADVVDDDKEEEQQQQDEVSPTTTKQIGHKQNTPKIYYPLDETKRNSSNIYATKIEQDQFRKY